MALSDRLKNLRRQERYSQSQFSDLIGVRPNTVWRWENGRARPDADTVVKIAEVLNTSVAYLLGEIDNPIPIQIKRDIPVHVDTSVIQEVKTNKDLQPAQKSSTDHLVYSWGDHRIEVPDTPSNQAWFREIMANAIAKAPVAAAG